MWCALLPSLAMAQSRNESDDGADPKPFAELEVKLPALPKPENLLKFEPSSASNNRFYVDAASIFVGDDGTVRYTLVIESASGAQNISHEGIRCETFEQKIYAYGGRDGMWRPTRAPQWRPVNYQDSYRQRRVLAADYFCRDNRMVKSREAAIQLLKYPQPPTGGTTVRWRDAF